MAKVLWPVAKKIKSGQKEANLATSGQQRQPWFITFLRIAALLPPQSQGWHLNARLSSRQGRWRAYHMWYLESIWEQI